VLDGTLPENIRTAAEMYAGCVSGAIQKDQYLEVIRHAGFSNIQIQKEKKINIPDEILKQYISENETKALRDSGATILSITIYAEKHVAEKQSCCGPECCKN
jgi:arsenite methyltransferase